VAEASDAAEQRGGSWFFRRRWREKRRAGE